MPTYRRFGALIISACLFSTLFVAGLEWPVEPQDEPSLTSRSTAYFSGVERTWDAAANGLASNPARWDPVGVPDTGDNITFDGTSVFTCNWNVAVTLGNFSMLTGYTGTVTQSVSFGCVDFYVNAGTFTGTNPETDTLTCDGNFIQSAPGAITTFKVNLIMNGNNGIVSCGNPTHNLLFMSVTVNEDTTFTNGNIIRCSRNFTTLAGKTLTLDDTLTVLEFTAYDDAYSWSNSGAITGDTAYIDMRFYEHDRTFALGDIDCPLVIESLSIATGNRIMTLLENTVLTDDFTLESNHATYTISLLHGSNYEFSANEVTTLGDRAIMTQGTGTWSFGSYAQTGASSVFNQGATLTIGGDFTVSAGVFNAVGDMTVPGDWDTATGDYVNDDNVVTLTGASKTLAMHAADSFYNITVSGSYTMDTDTTVRLRATISGTVDGTGDFLEPEPEFTSIPWVKACPLTLYEYDVTQLYWDELAIDSAPYWLNIYDGVLKGIPGENETGIYNISLTLTWNDMVTYQNFTLVVCAEAISPYQFASFELAIALCFCFGIMLAGFKERMLLILAGLVWMVCGIAIFIDYGDAFLYISIGLGASLLFKGAYDVWK